MSTTLKKGPSRKRPSSKRTLLYKTIHYLVVLIFIAFILGSLGWYFKPILTANKVEYTLAQQGKIEHQVNVKGYFANEEFVVYAPASGTLKYTVTNNQRLRRGETIATLVESNTPVTISEGGLFYNFTDGLETVMTRGNLINLDLKSLVNQEGQKSIVAPAVTAGSPVGKMVNNHKQTAAFLEVPPESDVNLGEIEVGSNVNLTVENQEFKASVLRKSEDPFGIVVEFEQFVNVSGENRQKDILWSIKRSREGILVPLSSLWIKGEEQGVFVVSEGVIRFRRIKLLDQNEDMICVEGLPLGIRVVTNPHEGVEGLPSNH